VVAFGLGPSPSAELALGAWAEAKVSREAYIFSGGGELFCPVQGGGAGPVFGGQKP